jgi:YHS domain-containing protein
MLRFAIRLIVLLVLFLLIRSVLRDLFTRSSRVPNRTTPKVPTTGELKRDPVCGTYVHAQTGLTASIKGQVFYFCSEECRKKYLV